MLLNKDIKPNRNIYYIGSVLLECLAAFPDSDVDCSDLFYAANAKEKVAASTFFLALDWLYILGIVEENEGRLFKCS